MSDEPAPAETMIGPSAPRPVVRHVRLVATFAAILAPLIVFGSIAEEVWEREPFAWDVPLMQAVHARGSDAVDGAMLVASGLGAPRAMLAVVALVALLLVRSAHRQRALFLIASGAGAGLLNTAAKLVFRRQRPELWSPLAVEHDFGFPSGHAMGTMAVALALVVLAWGTRWRWPAIVAGASFVGLVGASRVYLGVHFPSDVLAGWLASAGWVMGCRVAVPFVGDATRRRMAALRAGRSGRDGAPSGRDVTFPRRPSS